jgi:putative DNA primase/helicase
MHDVGPDQSPAGPTFISSGFSMATRATSMADETNKKPTAKNYTRPTEIDLANVPEELRETPQWECWMLRDGRKIPIDATTGKPYPKGKQDSDKMGTATFWEACELFKRRSDLQGIGFRFKSTGIHTGIDLDDVCDPATGEIVSWARDAVAEFGTYAEISPSDTGLHILGRAKLLKALTKTKWHSGHIEMYSEGRYFTITGRKLPDAPPDVSNIQPQADEWYRRLTATPAKNGDDPATAHVEDEKVPKGEQDNWLIKRAGLYRAAGDDVETIEKKLLIDYHDHCAPPHDNEKRVRELARGVERYAKGERRGKASARIVDVTLESYDRIPKEHLRYFWRRYLPIGKLVHLGGNSGEGKTPLMGDLAARISRGAAWPDGTPNTIGPRSVILLTAEDDPSDTIKPRLELAGADTSKIYRLRMTVRDALSAYEKMLSLSTDLDKLIETAHTLKDLALISIDPITNYLGANVKITLEEEVRPILMPLALATAELKVTTVTVGHLNRRERGTEALHRLMGAAAFGGIARFIYLVGADPEDCDRHAHVLVQRRGVDAPSLRYRTFQKNVEWEGETSDVIGVEWRGKSSATAEDVVDPRGNDEKSAIARAGEALADILKKGRLPSKKAQALLKDAGHDPEKLNVTRVLRAARADSKKFEGETHYSWYLPSLFDTPEGGR